MVPLEEGVVHALAEKRFVQPVRPPLGLRVRGVDVGQRGGRRGESHLSPDPQRAPGGGSGGCGRSEVAVGELVMVVQTQLAVFLPAPAARSAALSKVAAEKVLHVSRVDGPVVALAVLAAAGLDEAVVEGEVVAHAVAPALAPVLVVGEVLLDPPVNGAQVEAPLGGLQDGLGDERDVGQRGLHLVGVLPRLALCATLRLRLRAVRGRGGRGGVGVRFLGGGRDLATFSGRVVAARRLGVGVCDVDVVRGDGEGGGVVVLGMLLQTAETGGRGEAEVALRLVVLIGVGLQLALLWRQVRGQLHLGFGVLHLLAVGRLEVGQGVVLVVVLLLVVVMLLL